MRALLSVLLLALVQTAAGQPLQSPAELAARLDDPKLRVVDIRAFDAPADAPKAPAFTRGHIAGALSAPYGKWRGPKDNPGALPDAAQLKTLIQSLGIDGTTPVVVVFEGANATEFGAAARVYWTLKAAGLTQLSILNGGMVAWRSAGLPETTEARSVAASDFAVQWNPRLIATQDDVARAAGSAQLIDARPPAFFYGEARHAAARTPGTLAGAKNVEHDVWFAGDSATLLPVADIRRIAQQQGIDTSRPTVSFCNSGHWAATNWFVLSEVLGQSDVSLYPESMVGWSNAGLPMANVPSRLAQFWLQLKEAVGAL